jgi:hypothetical protein
MMSIPSSSSNLRPQTWGVFDSLLNRLCHDSTSLDPLITGTRTLLPLCSQWSPQLGRILVSSRPFKYEIGLQHFPAQANLTGHEGFRGMTGLKNTLFSNHCVCS